MSVHGGAKSRNDPGAELNATLIQDSVGNGSCATRKIISLQRKKNVVCKLNTKRTTGFTLYGLHAFMSSYVFYNASLENRDNFDTR